MRRAARRRRLRAGRCWCRPATAGAHPLGNFSVNHLVTVRVSSDRVDLGYILDQAEIPTFQERDLPRATVLARKRAEVARALHVTVDGRPIALAAGHGAALVRRRARAACRSRASSCR